MWLKKFCKLKGLKKSEELEGRVLTCNVRLAQAGTCRWVEAIEALVDTGCSFPLALPRDLIDDLAFADLPVLSEEIMVTASEEEVPVTVVAMDVQLQCDQGSEKYALMSVPVAILPEGSDPLIGLPLMDFYNYQVIGGVLRVFGPNLDAFGQLDDWEPVERTALVRSSEGVRLIKEGNIDPTDNEAKSPKQPLSSGMNVTPLKDAFGKPAKPQGPKRSR